MGCVYIITSMQVKYYYQCQIQNIIMKPTIQGKQNSNIAQIGLIQYITIQKKKINPIY